MWIDNYNTLMFESINNEENTIKAVVLKNQNMPDVLYKYRTTSDQHIKALGNDFLMAVSPSKLNDSYEGALYIDFQNRWNLIYTSFIDVFYKRTGYKLDVDVEKYKDRDALFKDLMNCLGISKQDLEFWDKVCLDIDRMLEKRLYQFQNEIKQISEQLHRICSFSKDNDSNPMWAHYADDFKGYCVGYNLKELNNVLTGSLLPVRYEDTVLEVEDTFFDKSEVNKSFLMNAITRKSTQWSYENEWRLLLQSDNDKPLQKVYLPTPKVIILGKDISIEDKEKLLQIADCLDTKCLQQKDSLKSYRHEMVQL